MTNTTALDLVTFLRQLYLEGSLLIEPMPWEYEKDRLTELFVCGLAASECMDAHQARSAVESLETLHLLEHQLFRTMTDEQTRFVERVFLQHGCDAAGACNALAVCSAISECVSNRWQGHVQRFLRRFGDEMVEQLGAELVAAGMPESFSRKAGALWLQNVCNMPVILRGDAHIVALCERHAIDESALLAVADEIGINVAVLDDLLNLDHQLPVVQPDPAVA